MNSGMKLLLASACTSALLAGAARADTFVNGSFENGTLSGWTQGGGYWPGPPYPDATDYLPPPPGGINYDPTYIANSVTNVGFDPRTDNNLPTVYAGAHSAKVNDENNNNSVSLLSQRGNNYTDPLIAFAYAAVLKSSHGPTDSDAFIVTLTDKTTNEVLFTFNLNSATSAGTFTQSSSGWFYSSWLTQSVDVSARSGHDFELTLLANDCPYGGHAGYAYLDGFGAVEGGGGTGGGAVAVYWDGEAASNPGNGVVDGGDGVWDTANTNWTDSAGNAISTTAQDVIFAGAPGTVTVDDSKGNVTVNSIAFRVDGYVINGDPITLGGTPAAPPVSSANPLLQADVTPVTQATIDVGDGTPEGGSILATINAQLTGDATLVKTGNGTLRLNGVNDYTGGTIVSGGRCTVRSAVPCSFSAIAPPRIMTTVRARPIEPAKSGV